MSFRKNGTGQARDTTHFFHINLKKYSYDLVMIAFNSRNSILLGAFLREALEPVGMALSGCIRRE